MSLEDRPTPLEDRPTPLEDRPTPLEDRPTPLEDRPMSLEDRPMSLEVVKSEEKTFSELQKLEVMSQEVVESDNDLYNDFI